MRRFSGFLHTVYYCLLMCPVPLTVLLVEAAYSTHQCTLTHFYHYICILIIHILYVLLLWVRSAFIQGKDQ